jgi:triacylglycerol lipase
VALIQREPAFEPEPLKEGDVQVEGIDFSLLTGHACAVASCLAYEDPDREGDDVNPEFEARAKRFGLGSVKPLRRKEHYAAVFETDHDAIVSFRGTVGRRAWRTNFDILLESTDWGKVHRGFYQALDRFWEELSPLARAKREAGKRLWLTGHSMGGALAMLAAARLHIDGGLDCDGIYTFGQPPVGVRGFGEKFEEKFGQRYHRFVNHVDGVVDIPLRRIRHFSDPWVFDADGNLEEAPGFLAQIRMQWRAQQRFGGLVALDAHARELYANNLDAKARSARPAR